MQALERQGEAAARQIGRPDRLHKLPYETKAALSRRLSMSGMPVPEAVADDLLALPPPARASRGDNSPMSTSTARDAGAEGAADRRPRDARVAALRRSASVHGMPPPTGAAPPPSSGTITRGESAQRIDSEQQVLSGQNQQQLVGSGGAALQLLQPAMQRRGSSSSSATQLPSRVDRGGSATAPGPLAPRALIESPRDWHRRLTVAACVKVRARSASIGGRARASLTPAPAAIWGALGCRVDQPAPAASPRGGGPRGVGGGGERGQELRDSRPAQGVARRRRVRYGGGDGDAKFRGWGLRASPQRGGSRCRRALC